MERERIAELVARIDRDEAIEILAETIEIDSTWGNETRLARHLAGRFRGWGFPQVHLVEWPPGRESVVARLPGSGGGKSLQLNGHIDIYELAADWTLDPWTLTRREGKLHGAGIADMKAGTAACVAAAKFLLESGVQLKGDLTVAAVAAHFEGGAGTGAVLNAGYVPDAAIVTEPSSMQTVVAQRGTAYLDITTRGKQAHSSYPARGVNAILKMVPIIETLQELELEADPHPLLGNRPTVNIGTIRGGLRHNQVPDRCTIAVDVRILPGQSPYEVKARVEQMIDRLREDDPDLDAEVTFNRHWIARPRLPFEADRGWEIVDVATLATEVALGKPAELVGMMGYTDAAVYGEYGVQAVNVGPGGPPYNWADEYVTEDEYLGAVRTYVAAALDFCTRERKP